MKAVVVLVGSLAVLTAYGVFLKWSIANGDYWWAFPLGIAATVYLAYLTWEPADTEDWHARRDAVRDWWRGLRRRFERQG